MKRFCTAILLLSLLFPTTGCRSVPDSSATDETVTTPSAFTVLSTPAVSPAGSIPYDITDDISFSSEYFSTDSSTPVFMCIRNGASVSITEAVIDQVNAGIKSTVEPLHLIEISEASSLNLQGVSGSSECDDTVCFFLEDNGTIVKAADCGFSVTGSGSVGISVINGASLTADRSVFASGDGNCTCLAASDSSVISLSGCMLTGSRCLFLSDTAIVSFEESTAAGEVWFRGADNELSLRKSVLNGNLLPEEDLSDILVRFTEESTFSGSTIDNTATGISVFLDSSSSWNLTSDAYLQGFSAEDETLSNISSNGHSIFYNSEHEKSSWLDGKTVTLPGGGFLCPII